MRESEGQVYRLLAAQGWEEKANQYHERWQAAEARAEAAEARERALRAAVRACMAVLQRFESDDMDATPLPEEVADALEFGRAALAAADVPREGEEG